MGSAPVQSADHQIKVCQARFKCNTGAGFSFGACQIATNYIQVFGRNSAISRSAVFLITELYYDAML